MAIEQTTDSGRRFTTVTLPWLIWAAGLAVYLITLNGWISLHSLDAVDQVSGPVWQPAVTQPLTWLMLNLFRLVPEGWVPLALNLFAALCGATILGLLARTVVLLPLSRVSEERLRLKPVMTVAVPVPIAGTHTKWIPPLLAAIACGLQLTFWERATAISGEMLDLLLFAYIIRCLVEFRHDEKVRWLFKATFVFAVGMANNWGMLGFAPVFLAALIWLRRMEFFTPYFLFRLCQWGLAGLSFYLLLPLAHSFSQTSPVGFWLTFKTNLYYQTHVLWDFPRIIFLLLFLTTLLPVLVFSICQRAAIEHEGGDNPFAIFMSRLAFHLAHMLFLGLCCWVALDMPLSPRGIGNGQPLLPYYYISAVVLGFCSGYLLRTVLGWYHGGTRYVVPMNWIAILGRGWVWVALLGLPVGLVWRNLGEIRLTNGPAVRRFAEQLYEGLPAGKSTALSDNAEQLILLQAAVAAHNHDKDAMLVDLAALPVQQYQLVMSRRYGARWPVTPGTNGAPPLDLPALMNLVTKFAANEKLICLNPGFGYYQEPFVDEPKGLAHYLVPRATNDLSSQRLDAPEATANEAYWQAQWSGGVQALAAQFKPQAPRTSRLGNSLIGRAFLAQEQNMTSASLRKVYARAFDDWGVELQRLGRWQEASVWFDRAVQLKPDNLTARINLLYNQQHQRGDTTRLDMQETEERFREQFGKYTAWGLVIMDGGPVDEPTFLNETARVLLFQGNNWQSAADYARCVELAPNWDEAKLWFAQSLVGIRDYDRALTVTQTLLHSREITDGLRLSQLLFCQWAALQGLGRTNDANAFLDRFAREHKDQNPVVLKAIEFNVQTRRYETALTMLDQLLSREPNNAEYLGNKALVQIGLKRRPQAIANLTKAISFAPKNQVFRLNRAIALLESGELSAAQADYEELLKVAPNSRPVLFGLEEIAWRKQDKAAAMNLCQQYLAVSVPQSAEYLFVSNRLQQLKGK